MGFYKPLRFYYHVKSTCSQKDNERFKKNVLKARLNTRVHATDLIEPHAKLAQKWRRNFRQEEKRRTRRLPIVSTHAMARDTKTGRQNLSNSVSPSLPSSDSSGTANIHLAVAEAFNHSSILVIGDKKKKKKKKKTKKKKRIVHPRAKNPNGMSRNGTQRMETSQQSWSTLPRRSAYVGALFSSAT